VRPHESISAPDEDFSLELYKSLRGEIVGYIEKVPAIWLQKFTLVGAVIAFLLTHHESFGNVAFDSAPDLMGAAILAIPILAILLDAKAIEYSLHARAISRFIEKNFDKSPIVAEWESNLWGDRGDPGVTSLVKMRSRMTGLVTSTPTIVIIGLAVRALYALGGAETYILILLLISLLYLLGGVYIWRLIWPKRRR
jgi:hypothetical protein